jgi:hypothetical protein
LKDIPIVPTGTRLDAGSFSSNRGHGRLRRNLDAHQHSSGRHLVQK